MLRFEDCPEAIHGRDVPVGRGGGGGGGCRDVWFAKGVPIIFLKECVVCGTEGCRQRGRSGDVLPHCLEEAGVEVDGRRGGGVGGGQAARVSVLQRRLWLGGQALAG